MPATFSSIATTVPDFFRGYVARFGERCALEDGGARMTFAELDRWSNRVAHGLLQDASGEMREQPIAIVAPLAPSSVVLLLGALKAGRIFTMIDPREPADRVQQIVNQLGARLVQRVEEIALDRDDDPGVDLSPERPANVYFTSGSTGVPRGLVRTHAQLCYPTLGHGIEEADRVGLILPLAFAGSLATIFGPLVAGATGCFFDPITHTVESTAEWIAASGITLFQTAPTTLAAIAQTLELAGRTAPSVRIVIIGGEPCHGEQLTVPQHVFPNATIVNHYGSTEAGFIASTRIAPGDTVPSGPVPLRTIYPGQTITIVDDDGRPLPHGEPGYIHVARSRNVAIGWGPPREGDRQPIDEGDGRRTVLLRDRARLLDDGTLELIGRGDLRVKIHGQNVDLQTVEHALESIPGVKEAIVSAVPGTHGRPRLFAHYAFTTVVPRRDIRLALAGKLPPYAIPAMLLPVDSIPRNARGKVDRAALLEAAATMPIPEAEYVAPRTAHEQAIVELAMDTLGVAKIGVLDDLFDLGADSFTWASLITAINDRFHTSLALGDLLEAPTIETLSRRCEGEVAARANDAIVIPAYTGGVGTPLFCAAGRGGNGMLSTRRLGRRLGRPTFSFAYHGVLKRALPDRTVQKVAARFIAAMRTVQPQGPYFIAGLSFGGLLALEMAKQLHASGQKVALLVLIDPATRRRWHVIRKSVRRVRGEWTGKIPSRGGALWRRVLGWFGRLIDSRYHRLTAGIVKRPPLGQGVAFSRLDEYMAERYVPEPYSGPTLLLRTSEWERFDERDLTRSLTGPTRIETIPGQHMTMFLETNLAVTAAIIRDELAARG